MNLQRIDPVMTAMFKLGRLQLCKQINQKRASHFKRLFRKTVYSLLQEKN